MGGLLCKKNRNESPMSPVDRVIGRCPEICPQNVGKKKHFWEKQVKLNRRLETSPPPPLHQQPKLGNHEKEIAQSGWENATLSVPDSPGNGNVPPVAPPRKKRPSMSPKKDMSKRAEQNMLASQQQQQQQSSVESANNEDMIEKMQLKEQETSQSMPIENDLIEKLSSTSKDVSNLNNVKEDLEQIGDTVKEIVLESFEKSKENKIEIAPELIEKSKENKKEKKLIEPKGIEEEKPVTSNDEVDNINMKNTKEHKDETDKCVVELKEETEELLREINKEKGNLIFAMEQDMKKKNDQPDPEYEGQEPVIEDIIIPVKRKIKHICDDEEALRHAFHIHPCPDAVTPPKKPQRDFTKYKKSLENFKSLEIIESSQNQNLHQNEKESPKGVSIEMEEEIIIVEKLPSNDIIKLPELNPSEGIDESLKIISTKLLQEDDITETETIPINNIVELPESPAPAIPPKLKKKSDLPSFEKDKRPSENVERTKRKSEVIAPNMSKSEKILRRCLSTQSYLTPDLVEKIAEQANSLSLTALYLPEDYSNACNDGSGLVSPSSKLTEKRKLSPQVSRISQTKSEDDRTNEDDRVNENTERKCQENGLIKEKIDDTTKEKTSQEDQLPQDKILNELSKQEIQEKKPDDILSSEQPLTTGKKETVLEEQLSQTSSEGQDERKPKKRISVINSTPEEISKTIQSFITKDDLTPANVLKLLEDEFGDILHSKSISEEDKKLIEQLRISVNTVPTIPPTTTTTIKEVPNKEKPSDNNEPNSSTQNDSNKMAATNPPIPKSEKSSESNGKLTTITSKSHHYSKIPKLKNKTIDSVVTSEKRRHSIDELESWFSPKPESSEDAEEYKRPRRREASLPNNCLDSSEHNNDNDDDDDVKFPIENPAPLRTKTAITTKTDIKKRESIGHSPLLKLLEKERNNNC